MKCAGDTSFGPLARLEGLESFITFAPCNCVVACIEIWCNGSTTDFGSVCPGSNPGISTNTKKLSYEASCQSDPCTVCPYSHGFLFFFQTNIFPAVKVPVTLSSNKKLSQEFVARHFWDEFLKEDRLLRLSPDTSAVLGLKPQVFEETFDNYIVSLSRVDDTIAQSSMEKLVDRAVKMADDGYPYFFSKIIRKCFLIR